MEPFSWYMTKTKYFIVLIFICVFIVFNLSCSDEDNNSENINEKRKEEYNILEQNRNSADKITLNTESDIAIFETKIIDKSENRIHNLKLASSMIDGYVLKPGEAFSFNEVVGEANEERGFKKAIVLHKEDKVLDDGGGICQVSSTLYNAARQAGLEIIERHSHSKDVGYIPQGQDAAIAYDTFDLKFKNTYTYHIMIKIIVNEEVITVSIKKQ